MNVLISVVKTASAKRATAPTKAIKKQASKKLPGQKSFKWWSPDEHQRFLVGVSMFGQKDVKKISMIVGTRSPTQARRPPGGPPRLGRPADKPVPPQVRSHMQKYLLKKDAWDVKHEKKLERIGNNLIAEVKPAPCASDSECDSDVTCPSSPSRSCDSGSSYESSLGSASIEGDEPLLDTWESMELAPIKTDIDDFFDRCVPEPSVSGEERGNAAAPRGLTLRACCGWQGPRPHGVFIYRVGC